MIPSAVGAALSRSAARASSASLEQITPNNEPTEVKTGLEGHPPFPSPAVLSNKIKVNPHKLNHPELDLYK